MKHGKKTRREREKDDCYRDWEYPRREYKRDRSSRHDYSDDEEDDGWTRVSYGRKRCYCYQSLLDKLRIMYLNVRGLRSSDKFAKISQELTHLNCDIVCVIFLFLKVR